MGITLEEITKYGVTFHSFGSIHSYISYCIAEGLHNLGIPVYSNISYHDSKISRFHFKECEKRIRQSAAFAIVDLQQAPIEFFRPLDVKYDHPRTMIFSMHDGNADFYLKGDKPLLCCHSNRYYKIPGKRHPWAFGISSAIIEASNRNQGRERSSTILRNFRPSFSQAVRESLDLALIPNLAQHFVIDSQVPADEDRFDASHFERLSTHMGCVAYGGTFVTNLLRSRSFQQNEVANAYYGAIRFVKDPVIVRWDSWRFWESLAFGCLTLQLDLNKYGFELPVMPEKGVHYAAVSFDKPKEDVEDLLRNKKRIPEIAEAGRKWALENYSPDAVTRRFLDMIINGNIEFES